MKDQWSKSTDQKKDGAYIVVQLASMPASQPIGLMLSGQSVTEQIRQLIEKFSLVPRR